MPDDRYLKLGKSEGFGYLRKFFIMPKMWEIVGAKINIY